MPKVASCCGKSSMSNSHGFLRADDSSRRSILAFWPLLFHLPCIHGLSNVGFCLTAFLFESCFSCKMGSNFLTCWCDMREEAFSFLFWVTDVYHCFEVLKFSWLEVAYRFHPVFHDSFFDYAIMLFCVHEDYARSVLKLLVSKVQFWYFRNTG